MYFYGLIYRGEKLVLGDGKRISLFKDKVSFNGRHTYTREPFTNFYVPGCCLFGSVKRKSDICVYIIHPQVRRAQPGTNCFVFPFGFRRSFPRHRFVIHANMRLSVIFELLLIFLIIAFAAYGRVGESRRLVSLGFL